MPSKRRHPIEDAYEALEQLQMFVSGRVPAWDLPLSKMEVYKSDLRPVGRVCVADLQERLGSCKRWIDHLPKEHDKLAAHRLVDCCRRKNSRVLNYLFAIRKAAADKERQTHA
jgi:hypothetical protein